VANTYVEYLSGELMSIRAVYENGVLKPLEELPFEDGTEVTVDVHPIEAREESRGKRKSVKDFAAYGMWKDRTDFTDGVDYVNRIRKYRREPASDPK
jgi:predicted DNA-binding antitoxin AbrB/MazE fold protein